MPKTIAETFGAEVASVRDASTSFENAVEVFLPEDADEEYDTLAGAIHATGALMECAEGLHERLLARSSELEDK